MKFHTKRVNTDVCNIVFMILLIRKQVIAGILELFLSLSFISSAIEQNAKMQQICSVCVVGLLAAGCVQVMAGHE